MAGSDNVFTILRVPLADDWGVYDSGTRTMLLADDLPAAQRRQVIRELLTGRAPADNENQRCNQPQGEDT